MTKLARTTQKIFGSSAGVDQISEFGSLAAGVPAFTTSPATIQALGNYLTGWFGAVLGGNSPAIEDMNAIHFLFAYQLAYIMQSGTPEWDTATTYYKGSLASNVGGGLVYMSLTDTNVGNAQTDATKWKLMNGPAPEVIVGAGIFCTHATLAAAVADSAVGTNVRVLLTDSQNITSTVHLTKAGWRIEGLPGVTYTKSGTITGISCEAANIEIRNMRFAAWSSGGDKAISGTSAWQYGRVLFCNFNNCDTEVDTASTTPGKMPTTLGNITEV